MGRSENRSTLSWQVHLVCYWQLFMRYYVDIFPLEKQVCGHFKLFLMSVHNIGLISELLYTFLFRIVFPNLCIEFYWSLNKSNLWQLWISEHKLYVLQIHWGSIENIKIVIHTAFGLGWSQIRFWRRDQKCQNLIST